MHKIPDMKLIFIAALVAAFHCSAAFLIYIDPETRSIKICICNSPAQHILTDEIFNYFIQFVFLCT